MTPGTLLELHARELAGQGEGWAISRLTGHGQPLEAYQVFGCVPPVMPRRVDATVIAAVWNARDKSTDRTLTIPVKAHEAWVTRYLRAHGLCLECQGEGSTSVALDLYRVHQGVCAGCGGSGAARVVEAVSQVA